MSVKEIIASISEGEGPGFLPRTSILNGEQRKEECMSIILVTGAAGGLGRTVVQRALERGHKVRGHVRSVRKGVPQGMETFEGDIRAGSGLQEAVRGVDAIIHCASNFRESDYATDLLGSQHVIQAAKVNEVNGCKFWNSVSGIFDKSVSDQFSFSGKTSSPHCQNSRSRNSQIDTSSTKSFAVARPMPVLPPVMTATFPSSFVILFSPTPETTIETTIH
jgi:NAD(P)-dependent dehydrogenase (short-subunit alcohol dehydrogenase family)